MAGEIERLIEWLIDDISCHGDRGYPVSQTLATIQDYHHGTVRHDTPSAIMPAAAAVLAMPEPEAFPSPRRADDALEGVISVLQSPKDHEGGQLGDKTEGLQPSTSLVTKRGRSKAKSTKTSKQQRKGNKAGVFTCEKCGGVWKNDNGLNSPVDTRINGRKHADLGEIRKVGTGYWKPWFVSTARAEPPPNLAPPKSIYYWVVPVSQPTPVILRHLALQSGMLGQVQIAAYVSRPP
ncbi:hypothetical protein HYQ44_008020 [Verticillium longisporum]|nr:hypothetical protein HYQ44_008020 [Verticillium longisporum]